MAKEIRSVPSKSISEYTVPELLLQPGYIPKGFSSEEVDLSAPATRYEIGEEPKLKLHYSIITAPMQAVYSPELNVEAAKMGILAISHCSQPIETQAKQRREVRNRKAGFVTPDVVNPGMLIGDLFNLSIEKGYSTFPVTKDGTLKTAMVGYITANDYDYELHKSKRVKDRMIPREDVVVSYYEDIGEDPQKADSILRDGHHGSMPILRKRGEPIVKWFPFVRKKDETIVYMVFKRDIEEHKKNPNALVDEQKRYIGGDAINTRDYKERVPALIEAGSKFLYITTSQAYSEYVAETLRFVQKEFPGIPVGAGNIVTEEGFRFLVENGATCVGIGMGPGSICITREQIGVGDAQLTAILNVAKARDIYYKETGTYIPIWGDGGFSKPRHFVVGYVAGADGIMAGRAFAGTSESPTEVNYKMSPPSKPYWGEGSKRARLWEEGVKDRYGHDVFEEGVEGWVEYVGPFTPYTERLVFTVKDGMRKGGCGTIPDAHENGVLIPISEGALEEGRPHDINMNVPNKATGISNG
ncbi:MAG: IMP dehydrogenase [Candidatus Aenigmatarchaeota archaeon]